MKTLLIALFLIAMCGTAAFAQTASGPKVASAPPFALSEEAKAAGIDGTLFVSLSIDHEGVAKEVRIVAGPAWPCGSRAPKKQLEAVRAAVRDNLLATRFTPAVKNGEPQAADLALGFSLTKASRPADGRVEVGNLFLGKQAVPGLVYPRPIRMPKPAYPARARAERASGAVPVWVLIDENGTVQKAGPAGGHPLLQDTARDVACKASFQPATFNGQPTKLAGVITYNFAP